MPWVHGILRARRARCPGKTPRKGEAAGHKRRMTPSVFPRRLSLLRRRLTPLPLLTVIGEVTGFRGPNARSGHCYFQIKDDAAAVDCIIWRGVYGKRSFDLRDGMQVQFTGNFNLYKPTGRMSFVAKSFSLAGEGLLRQQVAALAEKLRREGLMDEGRKRPIPAFCSRVAVVTSLSGAVIDDVKRTPAPPQSARGAYLRGRQGAGRGRPCRAHRGPLGGRPPSRPAPDCILLVRGGGSFEDLMTFNDESLARAVAACPVPVITGIGHEPDTSICDMVSDRRCSTPTAAAESVAPALTDLVELLHARERRLGAATLSYVRTAEERLDTARERMGRSVEHQLATYRLTLDAWARRPCLTSPANIVDRRGGRAGANRGSLGRRLGAQPGAFSRKPLHLWHRAWQQLRLRLPSMGMPLALAGARLGNVGRSILAGPQAALAQAAAELDALSPLKVLARGYAIAYEDGHVVARAEHVHEGSELAVRFADGEVLTQVHTVHRT